MLAGPDMNSTLAMILAAGGVGAALLTLVLRGALAGDGDSGSDGAGTEAPSEESGASDSGGDGGGGDGGGGGD